MRFGMDGITAFSSKPLHMSFRLGLIVLIFDFIFAVYSIIMHFEGKTITGWTSLMIIILMLGSIQLITIGILGEYLGRIFIETKRRPHYLYPGKVLEKSTVYESIQPSQK